MKTCTRCGVEKLESEFYCLKNAKDGLRPDCKTCTDARNKKWRQNNRARDRYNESKRSAQKRGHVHDYDWERWNKEFTAVVGQPCPVLSHIILTQENISPDRIDNSLGYVHGNVQFISWRANDLLRNATEEEQICLGQYYTKLHPTNQ